MERRVEYEIIGAAECSHAGRAVLGWLACRLLRRAIVNG